MPLVPRPWYEATHELAPFKFNAAVRVRQKCWLPFELSNVTDSIQKALQAGHSLNAHVCSVLTHSLLFAHEKVRRSVRFEHQHIQ